METTKKVLLLIVSGFGLSDRLPGNAVHQANPEFLQKLFKERPFARLDAAGPAVGLPLGEPGNSEAGHLTIGSGRPVEQSVGRISAAIADGSFFRVPGLVGYLQQLQTQNKALHLCGMVSDGGVHSRTGHLVALLELAARLGLTRVFVHAFTDGRDSGPTSGRTALEHLLGEMHRIGVGRIATISGRYFAMDRDNHWDRLEKTYQAMVQGIGNRSSQPLEALEASYKAGVTDEFILPVVLQEEGQPVATLTDGDGLLAFNCRNDRMRQFVRMFVEPGFPHFPRQEMNLQMASLVPYADRFPFPVVFPDHPVDHGLGQALAEAGVRQFRTAETENYANITYFFNGRVETPFPDEDRFLIPSPRVQTYDLQPETVAFALGDLLMEKIQTGRYPFVLADLANGDMVGHTGNLEAAVKAVGTIDSVLSKVIPVAYNMGYDCLITSDHGKVEQMVHPETGLPFTANTANPVPLSLLSRDPADLRPQGGLADVAPTILDLLGLPVPEAMTGTSLLTRRK